MPLSSPTKILLTGGTSGIGAAMRDQLLAEGHQVIVMARTASRLDRRDGLYAHDCDFSNHEAVTASVTRLTSQHRDIGAVINNAALQYETPMTHPNFDPVQMVNEVTINLIAPALITFELVRHAKLQVVVNISSGLAFFPKQNSALYCATKAAMHSFSMSLRYQLEVQEIGVSEAILPLVDTPMTRGRGRGKMTAAAAASSILEGVKRGRSEIYIGKAKLLPLLMRVAPAIGRKILRGT